MKMVDRLPDVLAAAMGNQMYIATFPDKRQLNRFYSDIVKEK